MTYTSQYKELMTRWCKGEKLNINGLQMPKEAIRVMDKAAHFRAELKQEDVLRAVFSAYPNLVNATVSKDISSGELLAIIQQDQYRLKLIEMEQKISKAILNGGDIEWDKLHAEVSNSLSSTKSQSSDYLMLNEVDWDEQEEKCICSFGYPILDTLISGGVLASNLIVWYGETGVGKSTVVTRQVVASCLQQGKKPLIISLEFSSKETAQRIILQMAGLGTKSATRLTAEEKEEVKRITQQMAHIPIIDKGAKTRWELDALIRRFTPDVIIFDQITVASKSREWLEIAKVCTMLKDITQDTGIPIIALTQSNKQYEDNSDKEEEDDVDNYKELGIAVKPTYAWRMNTPQAMEKPSEDMKYSSSIRQDAQTVIKITKGFPEANRRILTIEKTKDDWLAPQLPVKVYLEWTPKGMVATHVKFKGRKKLTIDEYMKTHDTPNTEKAVINNIMTSVDIMKEETIMKVDKLDLDILDNVEDYDDDTHAATSDRLRLVSKMLGIQAFAEIADTFDTYTKAKHSNFFISSRPLTAEDTACFTTNYYYGAPIKEVKDKDAAVQSEPEDDTDLSEGLF